MKASLLSKNEEGTVMVVSMLILVLLTIAGVAAVTSSTVELQIAGNEKTYKENFFRAEGAIMENAQIIEDASGADLRDPDDHDWLHGLNALSNEDVKDPNTWSSGNYTESVLYPNTFYMSVYRGITRGGSLDVTKTRVHEFGLYGRSFLKILNLNILLRVTSSPSLSDTKIFLLSQNCAIQLPWTNLRPAL